MDLGGCDSISKEGNTAYDNILADSLPDIWGGVKMSFFFSESSHVAYQIIGDEA